jgi:hypothetical protein
MIRRVVAEISVGSGRTYDVIIYAGPQDHNIRTDMLLQDVTFEFTCDKDAADFMNDFRSNGDSGITINARGKKSG